MVVSRIIFVQTLFILKSILIIRTKKRYFGWLEAFPIFNSEIENFEILSV